MHAVFGSQVFFFFFPLLMGRLWSARENVSSSSVAAITIATDQQNTLDSIFGRLLWGLAGWLATGIAVRRRQSHTSSASDIYFSSAIVCRIQLGGVTYNKTIFFLAFFIWSDGRYGVESTKPRTAASCILFFLRGEFKENESSKPS